MPKPRCYLHEGEGYDRYCHKCVDLYVLQLEAENKVLKERIECALMSHRRCDARWVADKTDAVMVWSVAWQEIEDALLKESE